MTLSLGEWLYSMPAMGLNLVRKGMDGGKAKEEDLFMMILTYLIDR